MSRSLLSLVATILVVPSWVSAQTASGPDVGSAVKPLKVDAVAGDQSGKQLDFVELRKEQPTVYLFVQSDKFSRPIGRFAKELDKELDKGVENAQGAVCVAVWLTDDVSKSKDYLPRVQQSVQFARTTLAVFDGDKSGPNDWAINQDAHVTAVVVRDGKVAATFGYQSINETNVPEVVAALKKK